MPCKWCKHCQRKGVGGISEFRRVTGFPAYVGERVRLRYMVTPNAVIISSDGRYINCRFEDGHTYWANGDMIDYLRVKAKTK